MNQAAQKRTMASRYSCGRRKLPSSATLASAPDLDDPPTELGEALAEHGLRGHQRREPAHEEVGKALDRIVLDPVDVSLELEPRRGQPNICRMYSSLPQRTGGEAYSGGGGMNGALAAEIAPKTLPRSRSR